MPLSCCVENCSNNAKSQPNLNFQIFFRLIFKYSSIFFHLLTTNWQDTAASTFFHLSLADQLYAEKVIFLHFVTKCNQAYIKYSPKCIQQFLSHRQTRRVVRGYSQAITHPVPPTINTLTAFRYISLNKLVLLLPPHFFFIRTLQVPSKIYTRFRSVLKSLLAHYFLA